MTTSVGALLIADPGSAQVIDGCSYGEYICTIPEGTTASSVQVIDLGSNASPSDDDNSGRAPASYILTNNADITTTDDHVNGPLIMHLQGGMGGDGTPGGGGGSVEIHNHGALTLKNTTLTLDDYIAPYEGGGAPGIWDDSGIGYGIFGVSVGGLGGSGYDQDLYEESGGDGGDGNKITITNDATIALDNSWTSGASGIYAGSIGGPGGNQQGDCCGDIVGGTGGGTAAIAISNSGTVNVSGTPHSFGLWGIGVESIGGAGGAEAADGGWATGEVQITHNGTITVTAESVQGKDFTYGIAGIRVRSTGGDGSQSDDNSDPGGGGGESRGPTITSSGDITVTAEGLANPSDPSRLSGGIIAYVHGGRGGNSPETNDGDGHPAGTGGGVYGDTSGSGGAWYLYPITINVNGGTIKSTGNYVNGIVAYGRGGDGGTGRGQASGAVGGMGTPIEIVTKNQITISTVGKQAVGISAQSIGGTGGYQDPDGDGLVDFQDPDAGAGGDGGAVHVEVGTDAYSPSVDRGAIETNGDLSHGIRAQSFGGAGGGGESSFVLAGNSSSDAGGGGDGGIVSVINASDITTQGDFSIGILAQSIGGGGGDVDPSVGLISVAGDAQQGGNASSVTTELYGDITTHGEGSIGILAQSIGGGGGNGGSTLGVASVGGKGGAGGSSNDVNLTLHAGAQVQTDGDFAYGLVGQSITGGGGNGGSVLSFSAGIPAVGIGGQGSQGGQAPGTVTVTVNTDTDTDVQSLITTTGDNAHGIVAQSIGGGGGTGGTAAGADVGIGDFQMAGGGGAGGPGGEVSLDLNTLTVTTGGAHASGIMAQSIGGGGGTGGSAAGFDADVALALSASVGGSGATGGDGKKVSISLADSSIITGSDDVTSDITDMHGIVAQSIGGGGGAAGSAASKAIAVALSTGGDAGSYGAEATFSAGGSGGGGGYGGEVDITLDNTDVTTFADNSMGLIAQSVGGGGGLAGSGSAGGGVIGEGPRTKSANFNMSLGGSGGTGANGGTLDLSLVNGASVTTHGNFSNAILGHTIGGGGGNAGSASSSSENFEAGVNVGVNVGLGGKGGPGGSGGTVQFDLAEGTLLTTHGQGARGALLQSVGGGGGSSQGLTLGISIDAIKSTADLKIGRAGSGGGDGGNFGSLDLGGTIRTYGADADGVLAQSIGGGGGIGGSVGGASADDEGIFLEINDIKSDISSPFDAQLSVGGAGGAGGNGGNFEDVTVSGTTYTYGDFADGLVLQTVGGGGGQGGAGDVQNSISEVRSFFALGGHGGSGGDGGDITYTFNGGDFATQGFASNGVVFQSIGGGGGQGGSGGRLVCARINLGGGMLMPDIPDDDQLSPDQRCAKIPSLRTVDGSGGAYGNGGTINLAQTAANSLTVHTIGAHSHGIVAQSIGGGGGMGAIGSTPVIDASENPDSTTPAPTEYRVDLELGDRTRSDNGKDGKGGNVTLDSEFFISTSGDGSAGVLAQSIGAGGGISAVDGITSILMGADAQDDDGGNVSIHSRRGSQIMTTGESAHGLVAQSIGGGGGFATGSLAPSGLASPTDPIRLGIGNTSNSTGSGGSVTVVHDGSNDTGGTSLIATNGDQSRGIIAQSVGGGGGIYSGVKAGPDGPVVDVPVRLGGSNEAIGGSATVKLREAIITSGVAADGVVVQSIGAGGGIADLAARPTGYDLVGVDIHLGEVSVGEGDGGTATLTFDGSAKNAILTSGRQAYGALVQSVGGGGGLVTDSSESVTGALKLGNTDGGSGDKDGDGGYVKVGDYTATVATSGDDAHAIVAQSVGGGGGVGRVQGSATSSGAALTLGYKGANFGNGGDVDLKMGGPVSTSGDRAFGLVAQSIGGGGGIASAGAAAGTGNLQLGGSDGSRHDAANGGTVNVTWVQDKLQTTGAGSHGIIAQSIGGGGGIGGDVTFDDGVALNVFGDANVGGNLSGVGDASDVTVTAESGISVSGAGAYGVIAQSIGGGGGLGGTRDYAFAGRTSPVGSGASRAGIVKIDQTAGTISATGKKGVGILAQSLGDDFNTQHIQMTIAGTVHGGAGGAGIVAHGGNSTNTISVSGTVTADADENGDKTAISYLGESSDANSAMTVNVQADGTVDGDVIGTYRDGSNFIVPVVNASALARTTRVLATPMTASAHPLAALTLHNNKGGTIQGAGSYLADVENAGSLIVGKSRSTDTLDIAGDFTQTATGELVAAAHFANGKRDLVHVDGAVMLGGVLMLEPLAVLQGAELTMLTADGGISGRFSEIYSKLFTFEQRLTEKAISVRVAGAHFDDPDFGLNEQQANVAGYLGDLFMVGDVDHAEAFGALEFAARAGDYRSALSRLSPGASLAGEAASFESAQGRFGALLDCSWQLRAYSDGSNCLQLMGSAQNIDMSGGGSAFGYDGDVYTVGVAGQAMLTPVWRLGGIIGYETSDFNGHHGYGSAEGGTVFAGLSATRKFGRLSLSAAGVVSHGNFDTTRIPGLTAGGSLASADHDVTSVAGRFRAAYRYDLGAGYVTPMVDLDMIWTNAEGYTESGAGKLSLTVDDSDEFAFVATPAVEAGRNFALGDTLQLRLYGRAGISFSTLDSYQVSARFAAADPAIGSFDSDVAIPDVVGRISAGAELIGMDNVSLDLRYDGAFGSGLTSHAGNLRLNYRF